MLPDASQAIKQIIVQSLMRLYFGQPTGPQQHIADAYIYVIWERQSFKNLPLYRAPEAMQMPDAEWMERFEDLLQYRDRVFQNHYPSAMLIV